jgi:hypothetical protein
MPRRGAVALITTLVIAAALLVAGAALSVVGNDEIVLSGVFSNGETAFSVADACAEESLERLKRDLSFAGTTFVIDGGTCASTVQLISGATYRIAAQGEFLDHLRVIEANVTFKTNNAGDAKSVLINSWKEAD